MDKIARRNLRQASGIRLACSIPNLKTSLWRDHTRKCGVSGQHSILRQAIRSVAADEWFELLKNRVHTVIQRRPQDDYEKVKVAVLDTGIDASHPVFLKHVFNDENCWDWTGSGSPTVDRIGHGTHSAALVLRIAPNASLYIGKVFDSVNGNVRTPHLVAEASKKYSRALSLTD